MTKTQNIGRSPPKMKNYELTNNVSTWVERSEINTKSEFGLKWKFNKKGSVLNDTKRILGTF